MSNQPPQADISTLEKHLSSLTTLLEAISTTRHQILPNLLNSLKHPIQNSNYRNKSTPIEKLIQTWKNDSQDLSNGINSVRTKLVNSQEAMHYVKASSTLDSRIDPEFKSMAFAVAGQIIPKAKQQRLISLKSRSSLSKYSKSGKSIDPELIKKKLNQLENSKKIKNQLSYNHSFSSNQISSSSTIHHKINLNEIITSINKFNEQDNLMSLISNNHIVLNNVMHVFVAFQPSSQNLIIERTACFGLDESPKAMYHVSSFSLIRSITRCINHTISQNSPTSTITSSSKEDTQNQSNFILVCSLISSYKDFYKAELTNLRVKTTNATEGATGRMYIKRSRDPRLVNQDSNDARSTNNNNNDNNSLHTQNNVEGKERLAIRNNNRTRDSLLTWRRWSFEKTCLDQQLNKNTHLQDDDQMQIDLVPSSNDLQLDPIHDILSKGKWIPIPEVN